ncbi:MAG: type II toxin-antitoxin system death-on-curing family toxin [Anaerolineae bacterium]|nr:type II toxin-antitoxin system death-on-curing family toxin [Anaerolineae bacterium]
MRYLTLSELIYINGHVVKNDKILAGTQEIRDIILLEAAVARPAASAFGADAYPTLREKVTALFHSISRNHPFTDGNKRTATVAAIFMFEVNGERPVWQPDAALAMLLGVAEGQYDMDALTAWWTTEPCPHADEQDADRDMQHIATIIKTHRWLLDELATR